MKRTWRIILGIVFLASITTFSSFAAKGEKELLRANKLYNEEKFQEALKLYNQAYSLNPNSDVINFNKAAALYKIGNYQEAAAGFTNVLITDNPKLEAKANYNIGNSKYKQGEAKEADDVGQAVSLYSEALNYYRRAIELNEKDRDAKYNYEFVKKKLKYLKDKQKSMPKQKEQPQPKEKSQDQEGVEKEQKRKEERPEEQEQRAQPATEPGQMSQEEARMLLEGQEEKEIGEIIDKKDKRPYPEVLNYW